MRTDGVPWRRVAVGVAAAALALTGTVVALRSDGFTATDATVPRATRWFVHQATGYIVLADGFSGQPLARRDVTEGDESPVLEVAQSAGGAAVIDRSQAQARLIDSAALEFGPPRALPLAAEANAIVAVVQNGILVADSDSGDAVLLPATGDPVTFELGPADPETTEVAPDGSIWTLAAGIFTRVTTAGPDVIARRLVDAQATLVGNDGLVYDGATGRARLASGDWVALDVDVDPSEVVLQEPGPPSECGWVGFDDELRCVGERGVVHSVTVEGLDLRGSDMLAIAGDAAAVVRPSANTIQAFDWHLGTMLDRSATVPALATLEVSSAIDLVWIDNTAGDQVWAVHPWALHSIDKNDARTPLLGESGVVLEEGVDGDASASPGDGLDAAPREREPDGDGIDDPPVANDDPVTARTGASVIVPVTANDFDPDGEAIAVIAAGQGPNGSVEIGSATTVVYQPAPGFVGSDRFDYTISDAFGHTDTATVTIELLAADAPNSPPVANADYATTGPNAPVIVDVLLNDVDPERDAVRIDSFTADADIGGAVTETIAPSGNPALRYVPPPGASGTARFAYRPLDAFGAVGEPATVTVEIASVNDANRPPIARPDAIRVRRDTPVELPVLANDIDPDGDTMTLGLVEPLPPGLEVGIAGDELRIVARPGARPRVEFEYTLDDGRGQPAIGSVLVVVADANDPNRAPVANADSATAVAGTPRLIDVLLNDTDPDGDPIVLLSAEPDPAVAAPGAVRVQGDRVEYTPAPLGTGDEPTIDRFSYVITDGAGHEATGTVTVRVLPDALDVPPFARDDSATTFVDVEVTIDVLRNDGDPSGGPLSVLGEPGCAGGGTATVTLDQKVTFHPPTGAAGVYRCTYEAVNNRGETAHASIVISVVEPPLSNLPPLVVNEDITVVVGETRHIELLANDSDPDGPQSDLRIQSWTSPGVGTAVRDGEAIVYTAPATPDIAFIRYQVGDARGGVSDGIAVIRTVEPVPVPPIANPDRRTITGPGTVVEIDVLSNDVDPDGDPALLQVQSVEVTSGPGSATLGSGGTVRIVPDDPDFVGDIVATYTVVDPDGQGAAGTATLTILEAPNRPPIAVDDVASVVNGGTITVPLGLNDNDPDGDPLAFNLLSAPDPALGTATLSGPDLTFAATPGATGVAVARYEVSDGELFATAEVRIAVQACTVAPPEAPDRFFETGYEQPIAIDLTEIARNGEVVEVSPPLSAPSGVYTPPPGENGNVVITYVVRNSCGIQDIGRVTIDVNQAPASSPIVLQLGRHASLSLSVTQLASDDEPLAITGLTGQPEWVTVVDGGQTLHLEPGGRSGSFAFTVTVSDPGGLTVDVPINVELANQAPVAQPDRFELPNGQLDVDPLANDTDPDGDPISINSVPTQIVFPNGATGQIDLLGGSKLRIDPGDGAGTAVFEYTIVDVLGAVSAPATITVTVNAAPVAPLVEIDVPWLGTTTVAIPATDPDGDPLVATVRSEDVPPGFVITTGEGPTVTVTNLAAPAANSYDVPYTVTDPGGRTATGILRIVVGPPPTTTTTTTTPPTTPPPTTTDPPGPPDDPGPPGSRP